MRVLSDPLTEKASMNSNNNHQPLYDSSVSLPEFTFKAIVISIILAAMLVCSNAYLALKLGSTISASIPASVLALGILRFFKSSNVLETNMIQTAASGGEGVAGAVALILPAMIILHIWNAFPFWETFFIVITGAVLGVLFSIPLRKIMLTMRSLTFPEGTAVGNVLKVSASSKDTGIRLLSYGGLAGSLLGIFQNALHIISDNLQCWFVRGNTLFGMGFGFTPATIAAGYIVGYEVGISLAVGVIVGWIILIPALSTYYAIPLHGAPYDAVMNVWNTKLRFVGVGVMLVGGIWTMIRLLKPVWNGLILSFNALKKKEQYSGHRIARTERDIPIQWVLISTLSMFVLLFILWEHFSSYFGLVDVWSLNGFLIIACITLFSFILGFLLSVVCGYLTGLIGATNNPLSGLLIINLLLLGSLFYLLFPLKQYAQSMTHIIALMIIITTFVSSAACISNENLQDLKAGQILGATPWKQQTSLLIGVFVSALLIAPVLNLLYHAYGIAGVFPRAGMDPSAMMSAPQASLMATLASGLRGHQALPWSMVELGALIGIGFILLDEAGRYKGLRLPVLAIGLGIYLPPEIIMPMVFGGLTRFLVKLKSTSHDADQGILLACGIVAGDALMGVILAIPFVLLGSADALSIMPASFAPLAHLLGIMTLLGLSYWLYKVNKS